MNSDSSHLAAPGTSDVQAHTPAPWSFREWMHTDADLAEIRKHEAAGLPIHPVRCVMNDGARIVMAGDTRVALIDCHTPFKRGHGHDTDCAERDANARLIAAAPDLLRAARESLALLKHAGCPTEWLEAVIAQAVA